MSSSDPERSSDLGEDKGAHLPRRRLESDPKKLLELARAGNRSALARLLSMVEQGGEPARAAAALGYRAPTPYTLGLTGAPGAGKSTVVDKLITLARRGWMSGSVQAQGDADQQPATIEPIDQLAVLAVDPTSPFSGGAILGDRVRMQQHATDPSVFVRSMATRGHLGGLALAVPDAVRVLGAAGMPVVLVETVGVGQMEVEVASACDTTVVAVNPGWGDSMQANKAGLLEVADVFIINKADRPGVEEARGDLRQMLELSAHSEWVPPIVTTVGTTGEGVESLWEAVSNHRAYLTQSGQLERRRSSRLGQELRRVMTARLSQEVDHLASGDRFDEAVSRLSEGLIDPYEAADHLLGLAQ